MRNINDTIAFVFLDVAVVIVVARAVGKLFVKIGQPAVVGEIVAGILLGPTLLGAFPGHLDTELFPVDVRPYLTVLANLGLILFMFIVGIEVDLTLVRGRERIASTVSLSAVALPFGLGVLLATVLYKHHDFVGGGKVGFTAFALFVGVAMSITAFPVLARILTDRGMQRTPVGVLALACAAVDDVLAWVLLAVVVAVTVGGDFTGVAEILLKTVIFGLVMFLVVRPLLKLMVPRYERAGRLTSDMLAIILVGILLSSYATEEVGIHFIFGAFVFGVIMPRQAAAALINEILERLEQVSILLLLPMFFVITGLGVDVGSLGSRGAGELVLVLIVAIAGKFTGALVAARVQRVPKRHATALAILMNTRGLTELVILQVGVQLKVLDKTMFTMLVIMAVVTTMMTAPLLRAFYPPRLLRRDIEEAEQASLGIHDAYTVLVVTDGRGGDDDLVRLAADLIGHESPAGLVVARILPRATNRLEIGAGLGAELAHIASAGDDLRRLAAIAQARGITCAVHSSLGSDGLPDVAELARRADADLVVVYADWVAARGHATDGRPATVWPTGMAATIVTVPTDFAPATGSAVATVLDNRDDARAVLRVGIQAGLGRHAALQLVGLGGTRPERRAAAAAEAIRRSGLESSVGDVQSLDAAGIVFAGSETQLDEQLIATRVVRVRSGTNDADREIEEIASRITVKAADPA